MISSSMHPVCAVGTLLTCIAVVSNFFHFAAASNVYESCNGEGCGDSVRSVELLQMSVDADGEASSASLSSDGDPEIITRVIDALGNISGEDIREHHDEIRGHLGDNISGEDIREHHDEIRGHLGDMINHGKYFFDDYDDYYNDYYFSGGHYHDYYYVHVDFDFYEYYDNYYIDYYDSYYNHFKYCDYFDCEEMAAVAA